MRPTSSVEGAESLSSSEAGGFSPLDPFPEAAEALGAARLEQLVWAFLILGLVVRAIRYLLQFPLWPDETYLAHNYLDRGYLDLMRPLDFRQIAPILYLWVQKTSVTVLGFSEYSLRLYVFLCSVASLLLFRHLAKRLLRGTALLLAVGTFSVAYPLVRYAGEAKPYGSDLFVSLVLLTLVVQWWHHPQQRRWWWALGFALPLAILLSYPAAQHHEVAECLQVVFRFFPQRVDAVDHHHVGLGVCDEIEERLQFFFPDPGNFRDQPAVEGVQ